MKMRMIGLSLLLVLVGSLNHIKAADAGTLQEDFKQFLDHEKEIVENWLKFTANNFTTSQKDFILIDYLAQTPDNFLSKNDWLEQREVGPVKDMVKHRVDVLYPDLMKHILLYEDYDSLKPVYQEVLLERAYGFWLFLLKKHTSEVAYAKVLNVFQELLNGSHTNDVIINIGLYNPGQIPIHQFDNPKGLEDYLDRYMRIFSDVSIISNMKKINSFEQRCQHNVEKGLINQPVKENIIYTLVLLFVADHYSNIFYSNDNSKNCGQKTRNFFDSENFFKEIDRIIQNENVSQSVASESAIKSARNYLVSIIEASNRSPHQKNKIKEFFDTLVQKCFEDKIQMEMLEKFIEIIEGERK